MPYIGPSESQAIAEAQVRVSVYRGARDALSWFKDEWQAPIPERLHRHQVDDGDRLGGPALSERFRRYLLDPPRDDLRRAMLEMATGSLFERVAAHYLFALACRDFDPAAAGLSMSPPLMPEYSTYYAEKAVARLRERMERVDRPRSRHRACAEDGCTQRSDRLYCPDHRREAA